MTALIRAFGVVFVAELGDKTQLVAMSLGARHRLRQVVIGLALAYVVSAGLAAVVGGLLGAALPDRALSIGGGVAFIGFAVVELWRARSDDTGEGSADELSVDGRDGRATGLRRVLGSPIAVVAVTVTVAELGDKTQLATATLAADSSPMLTWIGATIGLMAAGVLGAVIGRALGDRLPRTALRYASAAVFLAVGVVMILSALP